MCYYYYLWSAAPPRVKFTDIRRVSVMNTVKANLANLPLEPQYF